MSLTSGKQLILTSGAAGGGGYAVSRSLRFNSSDSAYLSRTPAVAGNRTTWTWAGWVKRTKLGGFSPLFSAGAASSADTLIYFDSGSVGAQDSINWFDRTNPTKTAVRVTTQVFRDVSAWYHFVFVWDSNNGTAGDRMKIYVNGIQITTFSSTTNPSSAATSALNNNVSHAIGSDSPSTGYFDGYLADIHFIDGQALTPSSFTEVSATTGQLIPKAYTGTFGTNGFWLKFADNSSNTATTLGVDSSGNGNNWTPNNLSVTGQALIGYPQGLSAGSGSVTDRTLAFDGNTVTFAVAGSSTTITFTPPSSISFSSKLEFWTTNGGGPGSNDQRYSYNGGAEVSCSGGEWTTVVTGSGTLTSLSVRNTVGSVSRLSAIRVDNSILIYDSGSNNDSLVDTPTSYGTDTGVGGSVRGNYCTANPLAIGGGTLSNGNLYYVRVSDPSGNTAGKVLTTIATNTGKWYFEYTVATSSTSSAAIGITSNIQGTAAALGGTNYVGMFSYEYCWRASGMTINNGSYTSYGTAAINDDIIMCAFDVDAGKIWFGRNGTWFNSSSPSAGTSPAFSGFTGDVMPIFGIGTASAGFDANGYINFGQRPFAYTAPSGFKALCDTNLPAPVVAKPSTAMDVKLYTGNGSTQTISGLGFSPDLVWIKNRSTGNASHVWFDTLRGANKALLSNATFAEANYAPYGVTAFNADGFSIADTTNGDYSTNGSVGGTYSGAAQNAAWCWDAGSTTVTNTQGSITSSVRANPSSGFSVVTYTGTGANATVGHGLGVAPQLIITKCRGATSDWGVYHASVGATAYLRLNLTNVSSTGTGPWNNTAPTGTVFSVGTNAATNTANTMIAYCFAPVAGLSSYGTYQGNGSSDGPFVYTGFRPRWIMIKASAGGATQWFIYDTARNTSNVGNFALYASDATAETSILLIDILSNGFKLRYADTGGYTNYAGWTYIYAAFAESSFAYSRAR